MLQALNVMPSDVIIETSEEEEGGSPHADGLSHLLGSYSGIMPSPRWSPVSSPQAPTAAYAHDLMSPSHETRTAQHAPELELAGLARVSAGASGPSQTQQTLTAGPHISTDAVAASPTPDQPTVGVVSPGMEAVRQLQEGLLSSPLVAMAAVEEPPAQPSGPAQHAQQAQAHPSPQEPRTDMQQPAAFSLDHQDARLQGTPAHLDTRLDAAQPESPPPRMQSNDASMQGHGVDHRGGLGIRNGLSSGPQSDGPSALTPSPEPRRDEIHSNSNPRSPVRRSRFPDGVGTSALVPYGEADAAVLSPRLQRQERPDGFSPGPIHANPGEALPLRDHLLEAERARVSVEVSCLALHCCLSQAEDGLSVRVTSSIDTC